MFGARGLMFARSRLRENRARFRSRVCEFSRGWDHVLNLRTQCPAAKVCELQNIQTASDELVFFHHYMVRINLRVCCDACVHLIGRLTVIISILLDICVEVCTNESARYIANCRAEFGLVAGDVGGASTDKYTSKMRLVFLRIF